MNTLPGSAPHEHEPASNVATLFMVFLVLAALVLIGYFAFAGRPTADPTDSAITVEEPGRAGANDDTSAPHSTARKGESPGSAKAEGRSASGISGAAAPVRTNPPPR